MLCDVGHVSDPEQNAYATSFQRVATSLGRVRVMAELISLQSPSTSVSVVDLTQPPKKVENKNSKRYWITLTGWSNDIYEYRKKAVLARVRDKWPTKASLNARAGDGRGTLVNQELRDWLRPLVITFNDTNWPDYAATPQSRLREQVNCYKSWALHLNAGSTSTSSATEALSRPSTIVNVTPLHANVPPIPLVSPVHQNTSPLQSGDIVHHDPTASISQSPVVRAPSVNYWSESSSDDKEGQYATSHVRSNTVTTETPLASNRFNWDDVEVRIEAGELSFDTIWVPMHDLKPSPKHAPCHWADFSLKQLYKQLSLEMDLRIEPHSYQFVYLSQPGQFKFFREGAYRIALKRFSQMADSSNKALHLKVERRNNRTDSANMSGQSPFPPTTSTVKSSSKQKQKDARMPLTPNAPLTVFNTGTLAQPIAPKNTIPEANSNLIVSTQPTSQETELTTDDDLELRGPEDISFLNRPQAFNESTHSDHNALPATQDSQAYATMFSETESSNDDDELTDRRLKIERETPESD